MQDHIENQNNLPPVTADEDRVLVDSDREMTEHLSAEYKADLEVIASSWAREQPSMAALARKVKEALEKGYNTANNYTLDDLLRVSPENAALSAEQKEAAYTYFSLMKSQAQSYGITLKPEMTKFKQEQQRRRNSDADTSGGEITTGVL